MNITGFCPIIVTKDQDSVIATFEALGFEKRHTKTDIEGGANIGVAMKDANGNRILVASTKNDRADINAVLINVDNFQEAYAFFIGK